MQKISRGFTLIEMMIVVIVIGILAAIAIPSYNNSLVKGTRANVQSFMMNVAQKEQQMLLDTRSYTALSTAAQYSAIGTPIPSEVSDFYTVAVTVGAGPPPTFTITATPIAGKRNAGDGTLMLDNLGTRTPASKW